MTILQMLLAGGGFAIVDLTTISVSDFAIDPLNAFARAEYQPDGRVLNHDLVFVANWGLPTTPGAGANYWIRATLVSGISPSGSALNTWLRLDSVHGWNLSMTTIGTRTCDLTIHIATDSGGASIVETHALWISAEKDL